MTHSCHHHGTKGLRAQTATVATAATGDTVRRQPKEVTAGGEALEEGGSDSLVGGIGRLTTTRAGPPHSQVRSDECAHSHRRRSIRL